MQYTLPTWALPVAIEVAATWHSLSGINGTWTLRTLRVLNRDQLYAKLACAVRFGSVMDCRMIMDEYGMQAFDVIDTNSTYDEQTLFAVSSLKSQP